MATQLADSPPVQGPSEAAPVSETPVAPAPETPVAPPSAPASRPCPECRAPLAPGQDWCLQCGTGAPGREGGGWRGLASVLAVTALLVLGAAAAGYAALSKKPRTATTMTTTVAQATPPVLTTPAPALTTTPAPLGSVTVKAPKIPLKVATPLPAATTPVVTPVTPVTPLVTPSRGKSNTGGGASGEAPPPEAIVLDTNAAQTYNPYSYPAAWFGDPSLTIDGDPTTGWSAQVNPATAPNLAEGLLLDLKSALKLSAVKLVTSTPGMTVQVYGSSASTVPASITAPGWVALSRSVNIKKRHARLPLRNRKKSYRYVTVWISKAPQSALGTPEAPGKITLDEVELLPAG